MRRVIGPTDHVVIVGAGLGGLSAALRCVGAGRAATVLERGEHPGGCAGVLEADGYRFDTGPTVLTMPDLIADALGCVDESLGDWLELTRLEPAYRAWFADGDHLDVLSNVDAMADQIAQRCSPRDADGYRRFADFARQLYHLEMREFIDRNFDSPIDVVGPTLARLVAIGGFRRLGSKVASFVRDPRLQRILSFQAMYAGVSPADALAIYAVVAYMDTIAGVWFPTGGLHSVATALAGAAEKHGVVFRYGATATQVEMSDDRAVAVHTADGDRITADVVIVNADLAEADRLLGRDRRQRRRRQEHSPSCVLLLAGVRTSYEHAAHHNLHFGNEWQRTFDEVISEGQLMSDPSLLVSIPTTTDPTLAPAGSASLHVVAPAPNRATSTIDWKTTGPRYRDELIEHLEDLGYSDVSNTIEVEHVTTPADWERQGFSAGTPFSLAQTFRQTGPFRPDNLVAANVVLAGCGTRPGVGVPMVLVSGRLAAERVVGSTQ